MQGTRRREQESEETTSMALTKTAKIKKKPVPLKTATKEIAAPAKAKVARKPVATKKTAVKSEAKPTGQTGTWEGYCVKCKEKGVKFDGEIYESDNGRRLAKGPHKKCGTTVCRILGK